jgi:hypothetical protein
MHFDGLKLEEISAYVFPITIHLSEFWKKMDLKRQKR